MIKNSRFLQLILPSFALTLLLGFAFAFAASTLVNNTSSYLQVAAYDSLAQAQQHKADLAKKITFPLYIHHNDINHKNIYELQVGPLLNKATLAKAENKLKALKVNYFLKGDAVSTPPKPTKEKDLAPHQIAKVDHSIVEQVPSLPMGQAFRGYKIPTTVKTNNKAKVATTHHKVPSRLWNLRNVNIRSVIQEVSRETGKNFIVDPRVQGRISIISSTPINAHAVYQIFLSALDVLGYSAVAHGKMVKIVPSIEAKQLATPIATRNKPGKGDEAVVRVVAVANVSAEQLVPLLRPLLPQWGSLVAYAPSNVLIIAGNASNVSRIANIIHRVDITNNNGITVMPLHYATASDVVKTIKSLQEGNKQGQTGEATVAAETQSNTILISGAKSARLKIRVLVSELDTPSANGSSGNTQVIYLHYMKAQDIVPILAGVAKSYGSSVGTVIGSISDQTSYSANASGSAGGNFGEHSSGGFGDSQSAGLQHSSFAQQAISSQIQGEAGKPKVEIIGDPNTNSVIINAPPTLMRTMKSVIAQLDIRPAQVLVEAMVAEVDQNNVAELGIQWGTNNNINAPDGVGGSSTSSSFSSLFQQGIGVITKNGLHGIYGVLKALETNKNADILSTPSVVVLDNHEAKIEVGKQISVQDSSYPGNAGGTTTATPYNTFKQENVALHLYVTPSISQNNTIQMAIDQGNDTLEDPSDPGPTPIINISSIQTSVLVNSGDVLVLGGLIQNQVSKGDKQVPILGDIPIIGHLFGVTSHGNTKKMLMVFIRPIILHGPRANLRVTGSKYNFIRRQQLDWVRGEHYGTHLQDTVLKPWGKHVNLPTPFNLRINTQGQP